MFCRHHRDETGCRQHPEHCEHHTNLLEQIMGDVTKLITDVTALIARNTDLETENTQLKADAATQSANDQAAIDALDQQVVAALPVASVTSVRTQYVYVGADASTIDASQYTASAVAPDGRQVYTFAGDLNPGDSTGASADFQVYVPV
jgi:hypothetical protein